MWGALKDMWENGPPASAFVENQGAGKGRHGWLYHFAALALGDGHELGTVIGWLVELDNKYTRKFYITA